MDTLETSGILVCERSVAVHTRYLSYRELTPYWQVLANPSPGSPLLPELLYSFYQMEFACVTVAILMGGLAERGRMFPAMIFTFVWMTLVYCPLACWAWSGEFTFCPLCCLLGIMCLPLLQLMAGDSPGACWTMQVEDRSRSGAASLDWRILGSSVVEKNVN